MGHVARSIGIIRELLLQNNEIFVACDSSQQKVFEQYFPGLTYIQHDGYPFEFSGKGKFAFDLFKNRRALLLRYGREQEEVAGLVEDLSIDLVVSDHRYGFFSKKVPSVFVTHQLHLPLKWVQLPAQWIHVKMLQHFGHIWCLDGVDHRLAGKLSHTIVHPDIQYIGAFSRFEPGRSDANNYECLFVVSGPEPYAEKFFREIMIFVADKTGRMACIAPKSYPGIEVPEQLEVFTNCDWKEMDNLFYQSERIVSRAGYSTLMDLEVLNKKAILIPTQGQAEQIYLSQWHKDSENAEFAAKLV